ncbi:hypothetical protein [Streptomyces sp. NPDC090025]|uniref:hypothetical protein n=1 Tax=Streptomyces sp. NPDC090025 TaxID=3365922 RepID=UPI003837C20E
MRRATLLGAGAALALAAVAVSSTEAQPRTADGPDARALGAPDGTIARPMPEFLGRRLWRVFTALEPFTRLDVHDVSGADRRVLWPPNWWVCTQYPAPGAPRAARGRVVLGVVRKGEECPPRVTAARR